MATVNFDVATEDNEEDASSHENDHSSASMDVLAMMLAIQLQMSV